MDISRTAVIYPMAKVVRSATNFSLGDYSKIDDFAFIFAGEECCIGKFVHISSFVSVIGGGRFIMEDFSGLSAGCRIITGTDDFRGPYLTNSSVPSEFTHVVTSTVTIKKHAVLGTNAIVFPGVTVGEGAAIGAGCIIRKDVDPWGIYAGTNPKKVGERDRDAIQRKENELFAEISASP